MRTPLIALLRRLLAFLEGEDVLLVAARAVVREVEQRPVRVGGKHAGLVKNLVATRALKALAPQASTSQIKLAIERAVQERR